MAAMVRKQFRITEAQDRKLKRRAKVLGLSEAEVIRRALALLLKEDNLIIPRPGAITESERRRALAELLANTRDLSDGRSPSESVRADYALKGREAFYAR